MGDIEEKVDDLHKLMDKLCTRLSRIEEKSTSNYSEKERYNGLPVMGQGARKKVPTGHQSDLQGAVGGFDTEEHSYARPGHQIHSVGPTATGDSTADPQSQLQEEYATIHNALAGVKLPAEQHISQSLTRSGILRSDQTAFNIVKTCAGYVETALKWTGVQQPDHIAKEDLVYLHTILLAQLRYLHSEYQALLVQSNFDSDTSKFFRILQKESNNFSEASLANLRTAVEISTLRGRQSGNRRGGYRGGGSYRGGHRGGYRGGYSYSNRGGYDPFHQFTGKSVSRTPSGPPDDN